MEELKEKIISLASEGNIIVNTIEGLNIYKVEDIVKQSTDELLYDLNRDEATLLTLMSEEHKWTINDFAMVQILKWYKEKYENLLNKENNENE